MEQDVTEILERLDSLTPFEQIAARWQHGTQIPSVWPYETGLQGGLEAMQSGTGLLGWIGWVIGNLLEAFYNLFYMAFHPRDWMAWMGGLETTEDKQSLMRFVYYGASVEMFYMLFAVFLGITIMGWFHREALWRVVRGMEFGLNWLGRIAAWAGLLMVLQQVMIVFLQRIFRVSEISIGPLGTAFTRDLSWYSEELKLYNAIVVCLCVAWTFIQGGHVRVDLVYGAVNHHKKRAIDMAGAILFMMPALLLTWMYAWFFLWRHLIVPNPSASDTLERLMTKARAVRWNVETIAFSPNGFDAYFLFKILIVLFTATAFLQACVFFWRSWLEYREGEISAGRYHDKDILGDETAEKVAEIH